MSTDEVEASGAGIREAEEEVRKAQERLRKAKEQAAADQDRAESLPVSGRHNAQMGAKGFGWFVAGVALVLLGAALWIGLANYTTQGDCTTPLPLIGGGVPTPICQQVTHAGQGAVTFIVLGGIGAVCLIAGYLSRSRTR